MTRIRLALAAGLAVVLLAAGCAAMPVSTLQKTLIWGVGFSAVEDVAYGSDPRQRLDVYTPRGEPPKATVLFLYGGSWRTGSKDLYRFLGQALASRGIQTVVADYRLYPQARYPEFVEDGALAAAWVAANIRAYGGDPSRLFVMGHSAGGYNAAMLGVAPEFLAARGLSPASLRGVVALAAPLTFDPAEWESTRDVFGLKPGETAAARPIKRARADAPPFLLLHGTGDRTVGDHNSRNFAAAMNAAGADARAILYEGTDHLGVVTCFVWGLRWRAPCLDDVDAFVTAHLARPAALRRSPAL